MRASTYLISCATVCLVPCTFAFLAACVAKCVTHNSLLNTCHAAPNHSPPTHAALPSSSQEASESSRQEGSRLFKSSVRDSGSESLLRRNSSRRTLGRVLLYHNSAGQAVVPPVGHQLSLKYSLMQEGVEVRS